MPCTREEDLDPSGERKEMRVVAVGRGKTDAPRRDKMIH